MKALKALIVTPDRDRVPGDWSGAFSVEATRLCLAHQLAPSSSRCSINMARPPDEQRHQLLQALGAGLDLVAVICHGWRGGLQVGWTLREVPQLAAALAAAGSPDLRIALYACSTAMDAEGRPGTAGDGGFADALRDALVEEMPGWRGCVVAHDRAGHCCSNPFVVLMDASSSAGGQWLIAPDDPLWPRWAAQLRDRSVGSTLRLRYPLMTREEIAQELSR